MIKINNYTVSHPQHFTAKQTYKPQINPNGTNDTHKISKGAKTAGTVAGVGITGALCILNRKKLSKTFGVFAGSIMDGVSGLFNSNAVKQIDVSMYKGVNLKERAKKEFLEMFIDEINNPNIVEIQTAEGTKVKKRFTPPNGYMLYGPKSQAKEELFNWALQEMKNAGVEIIDAGKGKSVKDAHNDIYKAWWDMWKNTSDEEFLQHGKYKVFVLRDLDEYPACTNFLKDSPDTHDCCKRHGVMLFYTCKNPNTIDPAVIRDGRVDYKLLPEPKDDEPLEIWKDYLNSITNSYPPLAYRQVESAKEILSKREPEVMEEMKDYLKYSIPYQHPRFEDSLNKWQNYVTQTAQNVRPDCMISELAHTLQLIIGGCRHVDKNMSKFKAIRQMTEEAMPPERLEHWKRLVDAIELGKI